MLKQTSFLFVFMKIIGLHCEAKSFRMLVLFFLCQTGFSQIEQNEDDYYKWFDELVEIENTPLYNGIGYFAKYKVINEYHQFFKSVDFLPGSIVYKGQYYPNIMMKYDLYEDVVLLNLKKGLRIVLLQPIKSRIDSFKIFGHNFKNINNSAAKKQDVSGFYELLFDAPGFQLLEKHKKQRYERKGKSNLYSEFKKRNTFILFYAGNYYPINNRKSLIDVFPAYTKEIQGYSHKKFPKENRTDYLTVLCQRTYALIPNASIQ